MAFQIGDKVIHSAYGMGEIKNIKKMSIHEQVTNCYEVRTSDLTVWVPIEDDLQLSLRAPASPKEFKSLIAILSSPGEELPGDRILRKNLLLTELKDGKLASICRVLRDLNYYTRTTKTNDQEKYILERAMKSLLTEWTYSLNVPMDQAEQAVEKLLQA